MSPAEVLLRLLVLLGVLFGPGVLLLHAWDLLSAGKSRTARGMARASLVGALGPYTVFAFLAAKQWIGIANPWDMETASLAVLGNVRGGIPGCLLVAGLLNLAVFLGAWWVLRRAEKGLGREA